MTRRKTAEDFIRDGFESWCITGSRFFPVTQALNGDYFNALTNEAWKAWKAAIAWQETQTYDTFNDEYPDMPGEKRCTKP